MSNILIVEDNKIHRDELSDLVLNIGRLLSRTYNIIVAHDYDSGEQAISNLIPDLVILDLDLRNPLKTGIDLFENVIIEKNIPVVIITAHNKNRLISPHFVSFEIPFIDKPLKEKHLEIFFRKFHQPFYKDFVKRQYEKFSLTKKGVISKEIRINSTQQDFINVEKIIYIESTIITTEITGRNDSASVCILEGNTRIACNDELGTLEEKLKSVSPTFERISRKYILNMSKIVSKKIVKGKYENTVVINLTEKNVVEISQKTFNRFIQKYQVIHPKIRSFILTF